MYSHCLTPGKLPPLQIDRVGPATIDSPLISAGTHFVDDDERIAVYAHSADLKKCRDLNIEQPMFEMAGPRRKIFFDPNELNCGVVTCGGLGPGRNAVIR